jgi:flagellar motility protein MotE (MotC chaperone)
MNSKKSSTLIRNFLKEFRNHLRIVWTLITKRILHEAFATLQEKISNEETTDQEKELKKFSNQNLENRKIENQSCLCDKKHFFQNCYYLIEKIRSIEWKLNEEIKKKINKIFESNSRFRVAIKYTKKKVKKWLEKDKKIESFDDESTRKSKKIILNVSFAETFVEKKISYKLINY